MNSLAREQKKHVTSNVANQSPVSGFARKPWLAGEADLRAKSSNYSSQESSAPKDASPFGHDFGRVQIFHRRPRYNRQTTLPSDGEQDRVDIPTTQVASSTNVPASTDIDGDGGTGGGGGGATSSGSICDQPISMNKVVSGNFLGSLTMGDYYPDLVGHGYWDHGDTGGPFDTGSRVGSNAQLWGDIRIPCRPDLFTLAQTVTYRRAIFNGTHDPKEGVVQDDIAKSGRDFSRAPARQEFFGGGGWAISMADLPSVGYTSSTNVEFDRDFVTSLVGPGGTQSVSWSTSIRIVNGSVTRNTIS